jgi:peptidylprolyl isomerase
MFLLLLVAALPVAWSQTAPNPATKPQSSSATKTPSASTAAKPATASVPVDPWIKLPPGVPQVAHLPLKISFALRYEDIKIGAGAEGASAKVWHLKYTGWRAADGVKFDSWEAHGQPVVGPDGKPVLGPDGKPQLKAPEPLAIVQGVGRVIPGFDFGLEGMKIGGMRRIFIPWQAAYGTRAIPDRPGQPGLPAKSDLIFDVELVDVTDLPTPPPPPHPAQTAPPAGGPSHPGASPQPNAAPASPANPAPPAATSPAQSSTPAQSAKPAQPAASAPASTPTPATAPAQPQPK